jgi:hypothetical protein
MDTWKRPPPTYVEGSLIENCVREVTMQGGLTIALDAYGLPLRESPA